MRYAEVVPDARLAGWIEAVWTLSSDGAEPPERAATILPDGAVEIVLSWTSGLGAPVSSSTLRGLVVGQMDAPVHIPYGGPVDLTGIRVCAAAAASLLGRSPADVTGRIVPLEDGAPAVVPLLVTAIAGRDAADRLAAIASALAARVAVAPPIDAAVAAAVRTIVARRGRVRVGALAREAGLSARQFERRFTVAVGMAPKRWARVARFTAAARSLARSDRRPLADLARDHGYADQAHFTREFGALAGVPPSRAWWT